jgi:hypothetical protein
VLKKEKRKEKETNSMVCRLELVRDNTATKKVYLCIPSPFF